MKNCPVNIKHFNLSFQLIDPVTIIYSFSSSPSVLWTVVEVNFDLFCFFGWGGGEENWKYIAPHGSELFRIMKGWCCKEPYIYYLTYSLHDTDVNWGPERVVNLVKVTWMEYFIGLHSCLIHPIPISYLFSCHQWILESGWDREIRNMVGYLNALNPPCFQIILHLGARQFLSQHQRPKPSFDVWLSTPWSIYLLLEKDSASCLSSSENRCILLTTIY